MNFVLANQATAAKRRVYFHLVNVTDGITPETGEAGGQPQISSDGGSWTNTGISTLSAIGNGRYSADLTQAAVLTTGTVIETRYKSANTAECPGDSIRVVAYDLDDNLGLGLSRIDAAISSRMATYTQPTGFLSATFPTGTVANTTNITAATGIDVTKWNGTTVATPATAGIPDVNVKNINNLSTSPITLGSIYSAVPLQEGILTTNTSSGTTVKLTNTASGTDNWYRGSLISFVTGSSTGLPPETIITYTGSTQTATTAPGSLNASIGDYYIIRPASQAPVISNMVAANIKAFDGNTDAGTNAATVFGTSGQLSGALSGNVTGRVLGNSLTAFGGVGVQTDVRKWVGSTILTPATGGIPDVNAVSINNVATTSVTSVRANIGTAQPINSTGTSSSALVKADVIDFGGVAGTFTSGKPAVTITSTDISGTVTADVTKWSGTLVATPNTAGVPVVDTRTVIRQGTLQDIGVNTTTVRLDAGASSTNDFYKHTRVYILSGTGAGQHAVITTYDGTTKDAFISPAFTVATDTTSVFQILPALSDNGSLAVTVGTMNDSTISSSTFATGAITNTVFAANTGLQPIRAATSRGASSSTTLTLDLFANTTDNYYVGLRVYITGGTGIGQVRTITQYVGATKVATITPAWVILPVTGNSTYAILPATSGWDLPAANHTDTGSFGALLNTNLDTTVSSRAASATALSMVTWTNSLATALTTLSSHDPGSTLASHTDLTGLNNLSTTDIKTQVVSALATDTYTEPTGSPAATATLATMTSFLYEVLRNKITATATEKTFYDNSGTSQWSKAISDDGTIYTEAGAV